MWESGGVHDTGTYGSRPVVRRTTNGRHALRNVIDAPRTRVGHSLGAGIKAAARNDATRMRRRYSGRNDRTAKTRRARARLAGVEERGLNSTDRPPPADVRARPPSSFRADRAGSRKGTCATPFIEGAPDLVEHTRVLRQGRRVVKSSMTTPLLRSLMSSQRAAAGRTDGPRFERRPLRRAARPARG